MQNATWIALLRRLPAGQHDNLVLVTSIGIEFALKAILRIERDYVVVRGRITGSSDPGRVFFVPYSQINYMGFVREMKEAEFDSVYGAPGDEVAAAPLAGNGIADPIAPPEDERGGVEPAKSGGTVGTDGRPRLVSRTPLPLKSELLERLRSRTNQIINQKPKSEE
jgi:hypothetical protein